jgi:hypothetical protein
MLGSGAKSVRSLPTTEGGGILDRSVVTWVSTAWQPAKGLRKAIPQTLRNKLLIGGHTRAVITSQRIGQRAVQ